MKKLNVDFALKGENMSPLMDLVISEDDGKSINRLAVIWAAVNAKKMNMEDLFSAIRLLFPERCQRAWFDIIGKKLTVKTKKWK